MSKILCAWELGGGLGHIQRLSQVAKALTGRGHRVSFAFKDLSKVESLLGEHTFTVLQAPVWLPVRNGAGQPANFAQILTRFGYTDDAGLRGMVKAWRNLLIAAETQLIIADFAPTAMLAAYSLGIPYASLGTGFTSPPMVTPLPDFRPWLNTSEQALLDTEKKVLRSINHTLTTLQAEPLESVADLYRLAGKNFLTTFRELDHYEQREAGADYCGIITNTGTGIEPVWPAGEGNKVFVYIKPVYKDFQAVLEQLVSVDCRLLIFAPGISDQQRRLCERQHVQFSAEPVATAAAAAQCDAAVCHGGHGLVATLLLAGKPTLLLPLHLEQSLTAKRVADLGAGMGIHPEHQRDNCREALESLLHQKQFSLQAAKFSAAHGEFDATAQLATISAACDDLC